jgi:hypothetical protein
MSDRQETEDALNRKDVLLMAAYSLLKKQTRSHFVLNLLDETAFYDGAECDGRCLLQDIRDELGIE